MNLVWMIPGFQTTDAPNFPAEGHTFFSQKSWAFPLHLNLFCLGIEVVQMCHILPLAILGTHFLLA
jgi:hypothetical protein